MAVQGMNETSHSLIQLCATNQTFIFVDLSAKQPPRLSDKKVTDSVFQRTLSPCASFPRPSHPKPPIRPARSVEDLLALPGCYGVFITTCDLYGFNGKKLTRGIITKRVIL